MSHDLDLGGPWSAFKPDQMPLRHQPIHRKPETVFRTKNPIRFDKDKKGNEIPIYGGLPKWEFKQRKREEAIRARHNQRAIRGRSISDVVSKLAKDKGGQKA